MTSANDDNKHTRSEGNTPLIRVFLFVLLITLVTACNGTALPATAQPEPDPDWWRDAIFYEVFVRSYQDSNADGIGDIEGLISRLDYLADLGVNALWLMPVMVSPSYHGYDVVEYYTVDADYGNNADFKRLIEEAHRRDMKVIIDLVLNHTGKGHKWFLDARDPNSARRDWYIWADVRPVETQVNKNVWHVAPDGVYFGLFWSGMPDLNYRTPAVTEEMYNVTQFWVEEMGVDGFRLDAIKHLIETDGVVENTAETHAWLQDYRAFYDGLDPAIMTVGEVWSSTYAVADYVGEHELELAFEFDLASAILYSVENSSSRALDGALSTVLDQYPPNQFATFLGNHDQDRIMSRFREDEANAKLAATLLLTLPGVPFLYYGEEIGMTGAGKDENKRHPMQWSADQHAGFSTTQPWIEMNADALTRTVSAQQAAPDSLLSHYKALIALRKTHPALLNGETALIHTNNTDVFAFKRQTADQSILVIINLAAQPLPLTQFGSQPLGTQLFPASPVDAFLSEKTGAIFILNES